MFAHALRCWDRYALALLIAGAMTWSTMWAFRVPIYQAPDEPQHLDYAWALSEINGLYFGRDVMQSQPNYYVHPYTHYLVDRAATGHVAFHPGNTMPLGYGTPRYFRDLDADAPPRTTIRYAPSILLAYPFGYYYVVGRVIAVVRTAGGGLVAQFYAARLLSVAMLGGTLLLTYATARRLPLPKPTSLYLTAVIAFLPLTSFVSSYVQPDNQSFLLVSLCFYASLLVRDRPAAFGPAALLGAGLGMLLVTKVHFFLCVFIATMLTTLVEQRAARIGWRRSLALITCLLAPAAVLQSIHLATVWDTPNYFHPAAPMQNVFVDSLIRLERAWNDFYNLGTLVSFWGCFGWLDTPLIIVNGPTSTALFTLVRLATWMCLGLTLVRLEQVVARLVRAVRGGHAFAALRAAVSNPLVNSYFLFTVLMLALHVRLDNRFGGQGRNWIPFLLPIFYVPLFYAPKAIGTRFTRTLLTGVLAVLLLTYVTMGSSYGLRTIRHRFFGHNRAALEAMPPQPPSPATPGDDEEWSEPGFE